MTKVFDEGDRIQPSLFDMKVLTALLIGSMTGYAIARRIEVDSDTRVSISNGTLYPALKRMEVSGLVVGMEDIRRFGNRVQRRYTITPVGRQVLEWETESLATLVGLVRLRNH